MKKALLNIILVVGLSCLWASEAHTQHQNPPTQTLQSDYVNHLLACVNLLQFTIANYDENYALQTEDSSEGLAWVKSFLDVYLHSIIVTICHELGHAAAAKLLSHSPINIHIGAHAASTTPLLATTPFTIETLNPYIGYAQVNTSGSSSKDVLILIAGGTSGLIAHIALKAIKIFFRKYKDQQKLTPRAKMQKTLRDTFTEVSTLDFIAGLQLANVLIPMGTTSNASKLWKLAGVPANTVDNIGEVGPFVSGFLITILMFIARHHQKNDRYANSLAE